LLHVEPLAGDIGGGNRRFGQLRRELLQHQQLGLDAAANRWMGHETIDVLQLLPELRPAGRPRRSPSAEAGS
jgi:hypothetical protein